MPLVRQGTSSVSNGQSSRSPTSSEISSRVPSHLDLLRLVNEARNLGQLLRAPRVDNPPWRVGGIPSAMTAVAGRRTSRQDSTGEVELIESSALGSEGRAAHHSNRRELIVTDNEADRLRTMSPHLHRHRSQSMSRSLSGDHLLYRDLDREYVSGPLLWANALSRDAEIEMVVNEVALPFTDNLNEGVSSRNHHRHSSMSTSPMVLEATAASPSRRQGGDRLISPHIHGSGASQRSICNKLEDALYFLDLQRLPPLNLPKSVQSGYFMQTFINASSWLRPGGVYLGSQSFSEESDVISALTRQLRGTRSDLTR